MYVQFLPSGNIGDQAQLQMKERVKIWKDLGTEKGMQGMLVERIHALIYLNEKVQDSKDKPGMPLRKLKKFD